MYLTRHQTSNVKMKAQFILSCIMTFIGIAGFITLLTLGLIYNFGVVMIGMLVFFFVVAIVGMVSAVNTHEDSEDENVGLSCFHGV